MEDVKIVPAKTLPGWHWHKYSDGSCYLKAPSGRKFISYDLDTNEYQLTIYSEYELFPLSYYYMEKKLLLELLQVLENKEV